MNKPEPDITPKYSATLQHTFITTYLVLFGYTCITLIEALRTPSYAVRNIMNIETTVSLVAGIVYGMFLEKMKGPEFNLKDITELRYVDWMITTPLILLGVVLFYTMGHSPVNYKLFSSIVALNWAMLGSGYLGEIGTLGKETATALGFVFLFALGALIFLYCIPKGKSYSVFNIFAVLWSLYGVAYMMEEENKNIAYNILDVLAKALFGIVLWMYFGKVLEFK
jgi:bacteriorhodopsin